MRVISGFELKLESNNEPIPIRARVEIAGKGESGSPVQIGVKLMNKTVEKSEINDKFKTFRDNIAKATTPRVPVIHNNL